MKFSNALIYPAAALLGLILWAGCNNSNGGRSPDDLHLARVYNKSLYLSDMEGMIPEGMTSEDSSLIISAYVNNWVKQAALLYEAEKNIPKDLNIDKLIQDYRSSLIKHNYENILVSKFLDSTITQVELEGFYEKNKEQYKLETPIIRCRFMKVDRSAARLNDVQDWWNSNKGSDWALLNEWGKKNAAVHLLQDSTWHKVEEIAAYMPKGTLTVDNVKNRRDFIQRDDNFVYFFKVLELVSRPELAPLSYIEGQARKVILHKRKTELLNEMQEKIYQEATRNNSIKIYHQ